MPTLPQRQAAMPRELPVMAILGLTDPPEADWSRLRGLQYASLAKVTVPRLLAHGIAGLITAQLFLGSVPVFALVGWLVALAGTLYYGARFDRSLGDADRRRMTREEIN